MKQKQNKILVAMSGGVDSSVASALLKEEGYEVHGAHMLCWDGCENNGDKQDAERVAARLDIPFYTFDFRKEYKEAVYNYMVREYGAGRTPNPDVMCNKTIKFGIFLKRALEMGFDFIATGHYVRRELHETTRLVRVAEGRNCADNASASEPPERGLSRAVDARFRYSLFTAQDLSKDQSYFLWTLTQFQLSHSFFPIGNYLKTEVREIAKKFGLPNAAKKDSQGLCFVGKVDFAEFIREALPKNPGSVLDSSGRVLGEHDGAHFYTLGQRHGLGVGGGTKAPLYIAERNIAANTLVVAEGDVDPILYRKELTTENMHWISCEPEFPLNCLARIRYRQPLQECVVSANNESSTNKRIVFGSPQRAIAPGQSIVFYSDAGQMLGGGVIVE